MSKLWGIGEVTGQTFGAYMKERIFRPPGMNQTTSDHDEAARQGLAGEWFFWKTGNIELLPFSMKPRSALRLTGVGALVILMIGIAMGIRSRKRRKANRTTD